MNSSRLTMFVGRMVCLVATMRTEADLELVAVTLRMLVTHAVNGRIILVGVQIQVWVPISVEEIKIDAMNATRVLTATAVLHSQIQ